MTTNNRNTRKAKLVALVALVVMALNTIACTDGGNIRDALHKEVRGTEQCEKSQCPLDSMQKPTDK